jgi:hypothetical protein
MKDPKFPCVVCGKLYVRGKPRTNWTGFCSRTCERKAAGKQFNKVGPGGEYDTLKPLIRSSAEWAASRGR